MRQLLVTVKDILENGRYKADRTKVGCYSVFGRQLRFDLSKGFPIPTTKKTKFEFIARELLWFIGGYTNIQHPLMAGVPIWDQWAVSEKDLKPRKLTLEELLELYTKEKGGTLARAEAFFKIDYAIAVSESQGCDSNAILELARAKFLARLGLTDTAIVRDQRYLGEIGPMYGKLMRDFNGVDQLSKKIEELKQTPGSRRLVVSMWNPATEPDSKLTPEENVLAGKQALASCHTLYQFNTSELNVLERLDWLEHQHPGLANTVYRVRHDLSLDSDLVDVELNSLFSTYAVPAYRLDLLLFARSQDFCVGTPFNIASYALLLALVANEVNMVPGDYVHTMGDTHIYSDQLDAAQEWISRVPTSLPTLKIHRPVGTSVFDIKLEDLELVGYNPQPFIKFPVAK